MCIGGGAVATTLWAFGGVYPGFQGQGGGSIGVGDDCMENLQPMAMIGCVC